MKFEELYRGYRPFSKENEIISTIKRSKYFDENIDISKAKKIQLLDTSKQKTYLVSDGKRIYKIIDDRRTDTPKISWSRKRFSDNVNITINNRNENIDELIIDAVPNKTNLVSKKLFANIDLKDSLKNLISS